mgnify:CR=1 FL=1
MNQITTPCSVCGRIADDIHHGRPHDLSQGVGMGGTDLDDAEHFHHVPLCRECHDGIHNKAIVVTLGDGWLEAEFVGTGKGLRRTLDTDEYLCEMWQEGDRLGKQGIAMQARAALAFRERYAALDQQGWYKRVSEIIRDHTGQPVSTGTVYDRCALGIALRAVGDDADQALNWLGVKLLTTVGKAADVDAALEIAQDGRDNGERMSAVARRIAQVHPDEKRTCEDGGMHVCRWCKDEWQ